MFRFQELPLTQKQTQKQKQKQKQKKIQTYGRNILEVSETKISETEILWLFRKDRSKRTPKDQELLIQANLAMVYKIANTFLKKHQSFGNAEIQLEDLTQAGIVGLVMAIEKYDSIRYNTKFSTYAYFLIAQEIRNEVRKNVYPLKTYSYAPVSIEYIDKEGYKRPASVTKNKTNFFDDVFYDDLVQEIEEFLTHKEFKTFKMFFVDHLSEEEIGVKMERSVWTVQLHIRKIKKRLKELPSYIKNNS